MSPVRELDPPNGDVTYTEELLRNPPDGVVYTTYAEALADGTLRRHFRRPSRMSLGLIREGAINRLRRRGVLFREPFSFFSVAPSIYDVIHVHTFSVSWVSPSPPVVVSNAAPIEFVYLDVFGWSPRRVAVAAAVDRTLARVCGVIHSTYSAGGAVSVSLTEQLSEWRRLRGISGEDLVVPNYVGSRGTLSVPRLPRIGLIAAEPHIKGADVFLEAVARLRVEAIQTDFLIIGSKSTAGPLLRRAISLGVTWMERVDRTELLNHVIPSLTALAYPSRFDGSPFILLEAMSCGVPILTSDYFALPEIVGGHGVAGLVHPLGSASVLADHMKEVLNPDRRAYLSKMARRRFVDRFAPESNCAGLLCAYERAKESQACRGLRIGRWRSHSKAVEAADSRGCTEGAGQ